MCKRSSRRGAMLVTLTLVMVLFMIVATIAIDLAQLHLARTELRTATDAAAKAAAETLARTGDPHLARRRGVQIAARNSVTGRPLVLSEQDVRLGRSVEESDSGRYRFLAGQLPVNSVRVTGLRSGRRSDRAVSLLLGNLLGAQQLDVELSATATYLERDVVLVIDRSDAMQGDRFQDVQSAIELFVQTLQATPVTERAGLASYGNEGQADVVLTESLEEITQGVQRMQIGGRTCVARGIEAGRDILGASPHHRQRERTMIVMTAGRQETGPDPGRVIAELVEEGVSVHTVTFGSEADQQRMEQIAALGRGRHRHAEDGEQLRQVYREFALTLRTIMTE